MNESEREAAWGVWTRIEDMWDRISHVRMDEYGSLMKELSGKHYGATTETMANDHHMSLAWMDGFCMALEWMITEFDSVQVIE